MHNKQNVFKKCYDASDLGNLWAEKIFEGIMGENISNSMQNKTRNLQIRKAQLAKE